MSKQSSLSEVIADNAADVFLKENVGSDILLVQIWCVFGASPKQKNWFSRYRSQKSAYRDYLSVEHIVQYEGVNKH